MKETMKIAKLERKMDMLMQIIPGGVAKIILNDDFDIILASEGFYGMSGYTEEEFYGEPFHGKGIHFIVDEDVPIVKKAMQELTTTQKPMYIEFRIKRKDGGICWNTTYCSKVELCGKDLVLDGIFINTTEIKEIENKIMQLTEHVPGGMAHITVGEDYKIDYANDYFYDLFGYSKEELEIKGQMKKASQLIYEDDRAMVWEKVNRFVQHRGSINSLEFRITKKSGEIRQIRVSAVHQENNEKEEKDLDCVFIDITESKRLERSIQLNEERYRIISEQTQDVIFDWDILTGSFYYSPIFERKFGRSIPTENTMKYLEQSDFVLEEDKAKLLAFIQKLRNGDVNVCDEIRFKIPNGSYLWCRCRATAIADASGKPYRAVGVIRDIDEYKRETGVLRRRAQIDLLTGLLNKMTAQEWIMDCLANSDNSKKHALFIIDIDDFKSVNDHLGHSVGDAVLTEIASRIKSQFRENDIIGRIGGDEFAVFMEYTDSEESVIKKAEYLCDVFRHSYLGSEGDIHVSGSIGIALYPRHGNTFQQLYECADSALYVAKGRGKDCYSFYSEHLRQEAMRIHEEVGDNNVESDEYSRVDFSQLIFEILYDISDINIAINIILDLISRRYNIERIFIYHYIREKEILAKIYEHSIGGISKGMESSVPCTEEDVSELRKFCDIEGVYLNAGIEEKLKKFRKYFKEDEVHSFMIAPIMDDGTFDGIIGYSESRKERIWKKEEVDVSILLAKIIVTFLLKRKHKNRVEKARTITTRALQQAMVRTHVVDDDYTLVDTSDHEWKSEEHRKKGTKCYERFYEGKAPCTDCPIHRLSEQENRYTYELYSSHNDKWEEITASAFQWDDGSVKYLLTCYDITKHKKNKDSN